MNYADCSKKLLYIIFYFLFDSDTESGKTHKIYLNSSYLK